MRKQFLFAATLALFTVGLSAQSSIQIVATADNSIYGNVERWNSTSYGYGDYIIAGQVRLPGNIRRGLLKFDIPKCFSQQSASIVRVVLTLTTGDMGHHILSAGKTFYIYACPETWGEGCSDGMPGVGGTAQPGDATWYSRYVKSTYPADTTLTIPWRTPGVIQPGPSPSPTSALASAISPDPMDANIPMNWTSDALTNLVATWVKDPCANNGLLLVGPETPADTLTAISFYSKDACVKDPSYSPTLTIYYTTGSATNTLSPDVSLPVNKPLEAIKDEELTAVIPKGK